MLPQSFCLRQGIRNDCRILSAGFTFKARDKLFYFTFPAHWIDFITLATGKESRMLVLVKMLLGEVGEFCAFK